MGVDNEGFFDIATSIEDVWEEIKEDLLNNQKFLPMPLIFWLNMSGKIISTTDIETGASRIVLNEKMKLDFEIPGDCDLKKEIFLHIVFRERRTKLEINNSLKAGFCEIVWTPSEKTKGLEVFATYIEYTRGGN
jgi:hypothetical protein